MPAPISVIIPTLNAGTELSATLAALIPGLEAGLIRELVIADGGSTDATEAIAREAGAIFLTGAKGRGGQLRQGVQASRGDWLLLLHADTHLDPGWTQAVERHLMTEPDKAAHFRLAFRAEGIAPRMVAGWANLRSSLFGLPYGDQGMLIARKMLETVGGVPDLPLMEDVALARALRGRLVPLDAVAATSAERYHRDGWLRRGAGNLWTLTRYVAGADPARLAEGYARAGSSSEN